MEIQRLFSTPFWQTKLELDTAAIASKCLELRDNNYPNRRYSNLGGWQSNDFSLKDMSTKHIEFKQLFDEVSKHVDIIGKSIHSDVKFRFNNAWININEKGHSNVRHNHAGSCLSAVVYLQVDELGGRIRFYDDWSPIKHYPFRMPSSRSLLRVEESFQPYTGLLLAFPGWVQHEVEPSKSEQPRVTIAINFQVIYQ